MSLSSLSSSSSAELGRYSTSSISTQSAPVISYSSSALMTAYETAPSCSLPERRIQLAGHNIFHNRSSSFDASEQINYSQNPKALRQYAKTKASFPKFYFEDLPLDVLDEIFKYFSNEDYLAFSNVNSRTHNLIWNPSSIYNISRSYRSFLANILVNFHINAPALKEEEFAPMINLVITEEIQKHIIERFMTISKPMIIESKKDLFRKILDSDVNNEELLMLAKFRLANQSFFEVQKKLTKIVRTNLLQIQTKMNTDPAFSKAFKNLVLQAKKEFPQKIMQEKNKFMSNVQDRRTQRAVRIQQEQLQGINQNGIGRNLPPIVHLPPIEAEQTELESNNQRASSCCRKVQVAATLAFALFGFWCFITSIYAKIK
jgi:hypothetical protein